MIGQRSSHRNFLACAALAPWILGASLAPSTILDRASFQLASAAFAATQDADLGLAESLLYGGGGKADVERAEAMLETLVAKGDAWAMLALGRAYVDGTIAGNTKRGVELLEAAGAGGNAEAWAVLGQAYLWGSGDLEPDPIKAQAYLEKAAAADNVNGIRTLGEQLLTGWVFAADPPRGEPMLEKLAADGDASAMLALGRAYVDGTIAGKAGSGVELLEAAGTGGNAEAWAVLGQAYLWGSGDLEADPLKAQPYLEKAAAADNVNGLRTLGEQLVTGWVFAADPKRGEPMLEKLVAKDDARAMLALGRAYVEGAIAGKTKRGVELLEAAGADGNAEAWAVLGQAYLWGSGDLEPDPAKAKAHLEKAAAADNVNGLRALGEQLVTGWVFAADPPRGEPMLEKLVAKDDARAMLALGRAYVEGAIAGKSGRGVELLEATGTGGNAEAWAVLGQAYLWGSGDLEPDPVKAQAYLEKAAAADNVNGLRTLGEQLVTGWVFAADPPRGGAMLEKLVAKGDVKAAGILGRTLLNGEGLPKDATRGVQLLEAAIQKGDAASYEVLGNSALWATDPRQQRLAQEYLTKAAEAGRKTAWLSLAQGALFGKFGDSGLKAYPLYERHAQEAGLPGIDVLSAQRLMWGIGTKRSLEKAIATLEAAAGRRNALALGYLIALVRDGDGWTIKPSKPRARQYLAKYGDAFSPTQLRQELRLINATRLRYLEGIAPLAGEIRADQVANTVEFQRRLFKQNPNLSVYLAQIVLSEKNIYVGRLNGLATGATIAAIKRACSGELAGLQCSGSPIGETVMSQIAAR